MTFDSYRPFTMIGLTFILVRLVLLLFPLIPRLVPILERLPPILIYVYESNDFYFVTSPLLIVVALAFSIWRILKP